MTKEQKCVVAMVGILAILAVLGLVVAGVIAPKVCEDSLWFMKRQSIGLGVGAVMGVLAAMVPWGRWLKVAPILFGLWVMAFVVSAAFPPVDGWCRYLPLGPMKIDTWTLAWPCVGIFLVWFRSKFNVRSRWLLAAVVMALCFCMVLRIVSNENRLNRVKSFLGIAEMSEAENIPPGACVAEQKALYKAWQASKWIGRSDVAEERVVPYAHTTGVSSGTAVAFGKALLVGVMVLFGVVLALLGYVARDVKDASGRLFIFLYGLWLCIPAFNAISESVKFSPRIGLGIPLVSFGLTATVVAFVSIGIVWSLVRENGKERMKL